MNDCAPTAFLHAGYETACQTHGCHDMQFPVELPFVIGGFHDRFVRAGTCIVDKDISTTESFFDLTNDTIDPSAVATSAETGRQRTPWVSASLCAAVARRSLSRATMTI